MQTGEHNGHLVADSGYALKSFCLTPYAAPAQQCQERYNRSLTRSRGIIERAIGVLKRRFSCMHSELRYHPERCTTVIAACVILHNIGLQRNDDLADDEDLAPPAYNNIEQVIEQAPAAVRRMRDIFAQRYFN